MLLETLRKVAVYSYDSEFDTPAPVLSFQISSPSRSSSFTITALVDSGADITVIPRTVAQGLSLQPVYVAYSQGFGGVPQESIVFSALVTVEGEESVIIGVLTWNEDYALLGRDIINRWKVLPDGPGQVLTVSK
jgi:hypothetical protein